MLPRKLLKKLEQRKASNAYRTLGAEDNLIDFSSNDYLGFASSKTLFQKTHKFLVDENMQKNGATGSRLLSGNHNLYNLLEDKLSYFHNVDGALVFNSGYDANVGFFSCVPQRGDVILFDEFSHASIRDGIQLSQAQSNKFKHNNLVDLERLLSLKAQTLRTEDIIYVVTESVFSMDGDCPDITVMVKLCQKYKARLVVDEAHAVGVIGNKGEGLVQLMGLQHAIFARVITFSKALGCHGAAILGSQSLKEYLVNFSRSLIYTTALSPHSLTSVYQAYKIMLDSEQIKKIKQNISYFNQLKTNLKLEKYFIESNSAIHCCIVGGNENVIAAASAIQKEGFSIKPIRYPTVAKGKERLRICLHSFNTKEEIRNLLKSIQNFF